MTTIQFLSQYSNNFLGVSVGLMIGSLVISILGDDQTALWLALAAIFLALLIR